MAQHVSPIVAMPQIGQPEQIPPRPQPAPADPTPDPSATGLGGNRLRPLEVAECSMCGVARPLGLLVPDGGSSCDGVRWYCKDVRSCTERWVAARQSPPAPAHQPSPFGRALAPAPPPAAGTPADVSPEARSIASLAGCPLPTLAV
jgi:hypothetical protein